MVLLQFAIVILQLQLQASSAAATTTGVGPASLAGCQDSCGNITIPYPFGTTADCYAPGFHLTCNETYNPPKLFINSGNIEVTNITLEFVFIDGWIARSCFDEINTPTYTWTDIRGTPYTFSYRRNRFTAVGCNAVALMQRNNETRAASGCMSLCRDTEGVMDGECSGIGCCQTEIPKELKRFDAVLGGLPTYMNFSTCNYAFVVDQEEFKFKVSDMVGFRTRRRVPVVLDWAVGNISCADADAAGNLLCGYNSECHDSANGPGYKCSCEKGYQGNPYLSNGCQDVNECEDPEKSPCVDVCTNTPGSYICSCSHESTGDGRRDGSGCTVRKKAFPLVQVVLGSGLGFLFMIGGFTLGYWRLKKKRMSELRETFFKQNGGLLLQQQISSHEGVADQALKIFTADELEKATDNYSVSREIGKGGYGKVYKGVLNDNRVVAIKKSKVVDQNQIEQFINEVVVLSQVIHRNVVKIIGLCLETQVPMLVYEYVSNGTLAHHLRSPDRFSSLSWEARLRIAAESAGALAYLHSAAARPIIHGDVKSANILLDDNYTAKVADFGASRLLSMNESHISTLVQGTFGYLDPEYFHTGNLTDKSDVYSFGVVLVELLTGEPAVSMSRQEEERSLAMFFIMSMEGNRLFDILEQRVKREGNRDEVEQVAEIAERCLRLTGEERPTMKEVAAELEQVRRKVERHPWARAQDEESGRFLLGGLPSVSVTSHESGVITISSSTFTNDL